MLVIRYMLIAFAGTALLVLGAPFPRYYATHNALDEAKALVEESRHEQALACILRYQSWAQPHPEMRHSFGCTAVSCYARLNEFAAALKQAHEVHLAHARTSHSPRGLIEAVQAVPISFINVHAKSPVICVADAPSTLRIPTSLVRLATASDVKPNAPRHAMKTAKMLAYRTIRPQRSSSR